MSRNLRIFAFAAMVFWVVGALNDATVMYALAGTCLAVILVAYLLSQLAFPRLRVDLSPPAHTASAGSPLCPRIHIRAIGSITVGPVELELPAHNMTVEGADITRRVLLPRMPPTSELDLNLELVPPARGRYRLGPVRLIDSDPIGMFEPHRERGSATELVVFPRVHQVPRVTAWDRGFGQQVARARQIRHDRGEFRGIREHTPGDDLRHVHWKVSAHVGELAVKEYEPIGHDVISIHLDMTAAGHYGEGYVSTLETAVSAAASIARAGLAEQRSVSLMGEGLPREIGRPGPGQAQLQRIMVALAEAQLSDTESFAVALERQFRIVPRGATVFVITTAGEGGLIRVLRMAVGAAEAVTLLIVEGDLEGADERFAAVPRRVADTALGAGINVATLRSAADIGEALALARSPGRASARVG